MSRPFSEAFLLDLPPGGRSAGEAVKQDAGNKAQSRVAVRFEQAKRGCRLCRVKAADLPGQMRRHQRQPGNPDAGPQKHEEAAGQPGHRPRRRRRGVQMPAQPEREERTPTMRSSSISCTA